MNCQQWNHHRFPFKIHMPMLDHFVAMKVRMFHIQRKNCRTCFRCWCFSLFKYQRQVDALSPYKTFRFLCSRTAGLLKRSQICAVPKQHLLIFADYAMRGIQGMTYNRFALIQRCIALQQVASSCGRRHEDKDNKKHVKTYGHPTLPGCLFFLAIGWVIETQTYTNIHKQTHKQTNKQTNKTNKQNQTKPNKTKSNKTKQNKTKQTDKQTDRQAGRQANTTDGQTKK